MQGNGLAAQMAESQQPSGQGPDVLQQIVELLAQGMRPEELVAKGVPQELVMQAVEILKMQNSGQPQEAIPDEMAGLAGMTVRGGM